MKRPPDISARVMAVMAVAAGDRAGNYMAPTLVECETPETATLHVEMFGPVMSLLPFDTEGEAIALANDSDFGLGSGVFTENVARAHRVSNRLRSGICWVNTYRAVSPISPFGGFNQSGYGREAGLGPVAETRAEDLPVRSCQLCRPARQPSQARQTPGPLQ